MKLTIDLEPNLINQLEVVARKRNTSISKIAESLFKSEVEAEILPFVMKEENELSDWVKQLTIATEPVADFDHKAEYHKHLDEKYGL